MGSEPPHELLQIGIHPQKIGVWPALSRQKVIGPIFFEGNLNAERYRDEILFDFIDQLDEKEMEHAWFQQDGAPAHTAHDTMTFLEKHFPGR